MENLLPVACAMLVLFAGCAAKVPSPANDDAIAPPSILEPVVNLTACEEFHSFYSSPPQGFTQFVPEGFKMAPGDPTGTTAQVIVFASVCGENREMWAGLAVIPPSTYDNSTVDVEAVVLQGFTTNATDLALYASWGLGDHFLQATARTLETNNAIVLRDETVGLGTSSISYSVHTTIQPAQAAFAPTAYRYWIQNGTGVSGFVLSSGSAATSLGAGTAVFSQSGDAAAPPYAAGVGHRVSGQHILNRLVRV